MICTEICTKDTLFIPNEIPRIKKLLEIKVAISSNKYKYIDSPIGKKLLIEGIKAYTICYSEDTKREKVVSRTYKIPFCSLIPMNYNGCGYKTIEFVVDELKVLDVNPLSVIPALVFRIICEDNFKEKDIEIINSKIMDIKTSESSLKLKKENHKKDRQSYDNADSMFSGFNKSNNNFTEDHNDKLLNYLIYQNGQVINLLLVLLIVGIYFSKNKLR